MEYTERLKLPLVEETDVFDEKLWNDGNKQIEKVCIAYDTIVNLTCPANQQDVTYPVDATKYLYFELVPTNPENSEEWNQIALASYRCWYDGSDIHLYAEGQVPTKNVYVTIIGWY